MISSDMMGPNETFRRIPQVHGSSRPLAYRLARRNAAPRSGVPKTGRCEPQQARPETGQQKAESSYAFRFRPRCRRNLERDFRFFVLLRRQFRIRQPLADDLLTQQTETVRIIHRIVLRGAIVEPESLFIHIAEQMKRFDRDIRSAESSLEQAPEVFHALSVNLPVYVLLKVIDELVLVLGGKSEIGIELIGHNRGTLLNKIAHGTMHGGVLAISNDSRLNSSATLKCSDYYRLAVTALHSDTVTETAALRLVHVPRLAPDECFVNLNCAAELAARILVLHPQANPMQHEPSSLLRDSQRT